MNRTITNSEIGAIIKCLSSIRSQCPSRFTTELSKVIKENWSDYPQYTPPKETEEELRCLILIDIFIGFRLCETTFGHICEGVSRLG